MRFMSLCADSVRWTGGCRARVLWAGQNAENEKMMNVSGADHIKKSASLRRLGLYEQAVAEIEDNLDQFCNDEMILALLQAFYAAKKGKNLGAKAIELARRLATLDSEIPTVNKYLQSHHSRNHWAAPPVERSCCLDHIKKSAALRAEGLYVSAIAEIEDHIECFGDDEIVHGLLQAFYAAKKMGPDSDKTLDIARKLAGYNPDIPTVKRYLQDRGA